MTRLLTVALLVAALLAGCGDDRTTNQGSPPAANPAPQLDSSLGPDNSDTTSSDPEDTADYAPAETTGAAPAEPTDSDNPDPTGSAPADTTDDGDPEMSSSTPGDTTGSEDSAASDEDLGSQSDPGRWVDQRQGSVIDDANENNLDAVDGWAP